MRSKNKINNTNKMSDCNNNENRIDGTTSGADCSNNSNNEAAARRCTDAAKKRKKKQMISELESFNVEGNEEEQQKKLNDRGCRKRKKINDGSGDVADVADDEVGQITPRVNNTRSKSTSTNRRSRKINKDHKTRRCRSSDRMKKAVLMKSLNDKKPRKSPSMSARKNKCFHFV